MGTRRALFVDLDVLVRLVAVLGDRQVSLSSVEQEEVVRSDAQQQPTAGARTVGRTSKWGREGEALMLDPMDGPGWCPDMGKLLRVLLLMG